MCDLAFTLEAAATVHAAAAIDKRASLLVELK